MTLKEQIRLYRLMEKLNWFFHQEMHYLDREIAEQTDREGVLSGNPRVYIRYFVELPTQRSAGTTYRRGGNPVSTLICSFDGLHDNRVLRYCADFEAHTLHMDTQTETGEKVSVPGQHPLRHG